MIKIAGGMAAPKEVEDLPLFSLEVSWVKQGLLHFTTRLLNVDDELGGKYLSCWGLNAEDWHMEV